MVEISRTTGEKGVDLLRFPNSDPMATGGLHARVTFNIRGIRYEVPKTSLENAPEGSVFSQLDQNHPSYDKVKDEFYFDRNPAIFVHILDFLSSPEAEAHVPSSFCPDAILRELRLWKLGGDILGRCCWNRLQTAIQVEKQLLDVQRQWEDTQARAHAQKTDTDGQCTRQTAGTVGVASCGQKKWAWSPSCSLRARIWSLIVLTALLVAILQLPLSTLPEFRTSDGTARFYGRQPNFTTTTSTTLSYMMTTKPKESVLWVEIGALAILTLDLCVRFIATRDKRKFFTRILNICDLVGVLPVWCMVAVYFSTWHTTPNSMVRTAFIVFSFIRLFRVCSIFRILRPYQPLQVIFLALKASCKELLLLAVIMSVAALVFGHLIFLAELTEDNVSTIPRGIWWAFITMTTVGYGDITPKSTMGYFVGIWCAMTGIVLIAFPVPIIVNNFTAFYSSARVYKRLRATTCRSVSADSVLG